MPDFTDRARQTHVSRAAVGPRVLAQSLSNGLRACVQCWAADARGTHCLWRERRRRAAVPLLALAIARYGVKFHLALVQQESLDGGCMHLPRVEDVEGSLVVRRWQRSDVAASGAVKESPRNLVSLSDEEDEEQELLYLAPCRKPCRIGLMFIVSNSNTTDTMGL